MTKSLATVRIRLACGHEFAVDSRPNPRKVWPDPQTCPTHKRKARVIEIHTSDPTPKKKKHSIFDNSKYPQGYDPKKPKKRKATKK